MKRTRAGLVQIYDYFSSIVIVAWHGVAAAVVVAILIAVGVRRSADEELVRLLTESVFIHEI